MAPRFGTTLLNLGNLNLQPLPTRSPHAPSPEDDELQVTKKPWYHYMPLCMAVVLLLSPHPSLLYVFIHYHLFVLSSPVRFGIHLFATYTLTFLAFCSLIVCIARDPGPVPDPKTDVEPEHRHSINNSRPEADEEEDDEDGEEVSLTEALMGPPVREEEEEEDDDDYTKPGRWCRVCWRPKPERTHHCSQCGRCVLKMDHHCPWMAGKCIGHRTYPSFLHFLLSVTLFAAYVAGVSIEGIVFSLKHPADIEEMVPVHMIFLSFAGVAFSLVIGSFLSYHIYLVSSNQTTIENISPYLLLRHIPALPAPPLPLLTTPTPPHPSSLPSPTSPPDSTSETSPTVSFHYAPHINFSSSTSPSPTGSTPDHLHAQSQSQYPPPYSSHSSHAPYPSYSPRTVTPSVPPFRPPLSKLSNPPQEHELNYEQRRLVKDAHSAIKMFDVGWRNNWGQVFGHASSSSSSLRRRGSGGWKDKTFGRGGSGRRRGRSGDRDERRGGEGGERGGIGAWRWKFWIGRIVWGGGPSMGDGMRFPKNPKNEEMLARLALELNKLEK